jgi:hypothetical protein
VLERDRRLLLARAAWIRQVGVGTVAPRPEWCPYTPTTAYAYVRLRAVIHADIPEMLLSPSNELLAEAPGFLGALLAPLILGSGSAAGSAGDIEALVRNHRLGNDDRLAFPAPHAQ